MSNGANDMRTKSEPVDDYLWFNPDDYSGTAIFGIKEWYFSLSYRKTWKALRRQESLGGALPPAVLWRWFYGRARPTVENIELLTPPQQAQIRHETECAIREFKLNELYELIPQLADVNIKLLAVDPTAPDTEIHAQFDAWLTVLRESQPLSVMRRGPKQTNVKITPEHLNSWRHYRVLECFDIDMWAEIHARDLLKHKQLCKVIMGTNYQGAPEEWGKAARAEKKKALKSIRLLSFQWASEGRES